MLITMSTVRVYNYMYICVHACICMVMCCMLSMSISHQLLRVGMEQKSFQPPCTYMYQP